MISILQSKLKHHEIEQYLPHSGKMSLLDEIIYADKQTLTASSQTHLEKDNPLRYEDKLSSINGIEYAAQSMAIHQVLLYQSEHRDQPHQEPPKGYLATVRKIEINTPFFPENKSKIDVFVEHLSSDENGFMYQFKLKSEEQELILGKITIFLA